MVKEKININMKKINLQPIQKDYLTSNNKTLKLVGCYTLILKCSFTCSFLKNTKPKWKQSTVTVTVL